MLTFNRPRLRAPVVILIAGFSLAFLAAVGTVLAVWSSREVALRDWEARLSSMARMLSAHAGQSIGAADLVLRNIADDVNDYRVRNDAEMRDMFSGHRIFEMLRESAQGLPQIDLMAIIAADGTILNQTRQFPTPLINLSDRDYFQAHMRDPALEVFLSRPVENRGTKRFNFYLARKIRSPDGQTLGIIVTGLHSDFFVNFYQSVGLGISRITLLRSDGAVLARGSLEKDVPSNAEESNSITQAIARNYRGVQLAGPDPSVRAFSEITAFDQDTFLPIAVSATASRSQVLQEWGQEALKSVILGGAMSTVLIIATVLLSRLVRQLELARNAALGAVEAKTRFVSHVSHELRTPMNAIIGGAHHLMQTSLTQDSQRFAKMVSSAAQQLMVLINDILDFSYYEARNFRVETAPVSLHDMARNTIEMTQALVPEARLEITCTVDEQVPEMVIADSARIKQVLLNLLGNAVKFTDHGSVELRVSYVKPKELIVLQVRDTGPGISVEDQTRIFEPFERTELASKQPGTGLGLTISKKIVEAMGGEIRLWSRPGAGTNFTIELPAPAARPDQIAAVKRAERKKPEAGDFPRPLHVLVAEDVAPSRMLLTMMLENMGHHVTAVENGLEALLATKDNAFDLILMDLQMPQMDGITATKRIRAQGGANSSTRIFAVSANSDIDGPNGLPSAGFDDSLLKPVTPERLSFIIGALAARP